MEKMGKGELFWFIGEWAITDIFPLILLTSCLSNSCGLTVLEHYLTGLKRVCYNL
jgi:hypothetical protein